MNKYRVSKGRGVNYTSVGDIYADSSSDAVRRLLNYYDLRLIRKDNPEGAKIVAQLSCDYLVHRIDPESEEVQETSYHYNKWRLHKLHPRQRKLTETEEEAVAGQMLDRMGGGVSNINDEDEDIVTLIAQADVSMSEMFSIDPSLSKLITDSWWYDREIQASKEEQRSVFMDFVIEKGQPLRVNKEAVPKYLAARWLGTGKPLFIHKEDPLLNK